MNKSCFFQNPDEKEIIATKPQNFDGEIRACTVFLRAAGVLLEPIDLVPDSHVATLRVLDILAEKHIPVVLLDRDYVPPPARSEFDLVGIDNFAAGYRLDKPHAIDRLQKDQELMEIAAPLFQRR